MGKQKRILFGTVDIGWRIESYSNFLSTKFGDKIKIESFVKHKVAASQYKTSYNYHIQYINYPVFLQWLFSIGFFFFALFRYDTFYFFSGETILTRKLRRLEFKIYRLLQKEVIMHFVGSDIRDPNYLYSKSENILKHLEGKFEAELSASWQKQLVEDSLKYSKQMIVSTPDLLKIVPQAVYYPVQIDLKKYKKELSETEKKTPFFKSEKIKVLHAPSNIRVKGSEIINDVLKEIERETDLIEFIYTKELDRETGSVYTVSRYELFQLYKEADIVIDQLIIGWYGLQSIEALLAGCEVMCFIEDELKTQLFEGCPIHPTNAIDLKKDVLTLIHQNISSEGTELWVKRHHTIEENNNPLIEAIFS